MKATCSVDNCDNTTASRGWCSGHLARWHRHGDIRANVPLQKKNQPCAVDGCDRRATGRGLCLAHYTRWKRTGETGTAEVWDRKKSTCTITDCNQVAYGLGLCNSHWRRGHIYGDPSRELEPKDGPLSPRWLARESLNYDAAHDRIKRYRGAPSAHLCGCGDRATDWAYQHNDPDPLRDAQGTKKGLPFSDDISRYAPMCRYCHKNFDAIWVRQLNAEREKMKA